MLIAFYGQTKLPNQESEQRTRENIFSNMLPILTDGFTCFQANTYIPIVAGEQKRCGTIGDPSYKVTYMNMSIASKLILFIFMISLLKEINGDHFFSFFYRKHEGSNR